ncbi:MAG: 2-dehydropantoate 2-reductase [Deltaproteobacteria bacterium]|nr:2-dehydropantoate 2-reductase [Deltaproteobacteria bacterium]
MKITVIGSGAMGCLFGGLLTEAGQEVQLLDVWLEHVKALNENGLSMLREGEERIIRVRATTDPAEIRETDLALIFVKHSQTGEAARTAVRLLGEAGHILTLQNGMGNAEIIAETAGHKRVICGTTSQGAMLLGPGCIQHSGIGKTTIGMWDQDRQPIVDVVAEVFSAAKIETCGADDIKPVIWSKLFANVGINAVTALTNIRNGRLLDLEVTRDLVEAVVVEAIAVARALQVTVADDALDNVFAIAGATATNRSSMGQDVDAHRPTEIDAINGYIVRRAGELGIEVPVNQSLTRLIKTLQVHY